jgi:hypothetical protein
MGRGLPVSDVTHERVITTSSRKSGDLGAGYGKLRQACQGAWRFAYPPFDRPFVGRPGLLGLDGGADMPGLFLVGCGTSPP